MTEQPDATDGYLEQWRERRPDLDTAPMAVVGRLHRLAAILQTRLQPVFTEEGLTADDFDVLATLRRWGRPMRPGELGRSVLVASGTVTKRLDRLERRGLVHRTVAPDDGRGRLVELTPEGLALTDSLAERHWANEDRLLDTLEAGQREQLAGLLRVLLRAHE